MAVNKVIYGDRTLIDISDSTILSSDLRDGIIAYDKSGNKIIGSHKEAKVNLWRSPTYSSNGVTISANPNGSVHISGTATTTIWIDYYFYSSFPLTDYKISCRKTGTGVPVQVCTRNQGNTGTTFLQFNEAGDTYKEAVLTSFSPYRCEIILFSGITYNCDLDVRLEFDSRNLLWVNPVYLGDGVTITENADGSVHITGTATTNIYADYYFSSSLPLTDYKISCRKTGTGVPLNVCTRNQGNTGTTFLQFSEAGDTYKEAVLTSFSPYRCEIVLFSGITYNCDLDVRLEFLY